MNKRGLLVAIFGLITLTAAGDESAHRNRPREFQQRLFHMKDMGTLVSM